jgi:hypothetical protein
LSPCGQPIDGRIIQQVRRAAPLGGFFVSASRRLRLSRPCHKRLQACLPPCGNMPESL